MRRIERANIEHKLINGAAIFKDDGKKMVAELVGVMKQFQRIEHLCFKAIRHGRECNMSTLLMEIKHVVLSLSSERGCSALKVGGD